MSNFALYFFLLLAVIHQALSLMCYQCAPSMPGCNDPFNWRGMGYLGDYCPEKNDICVKLIERKGADVVITRTCLSTISVYRTDAPTDQYEGCKPASKDIRLGHYVNNSIKEIDIKRDYYDETIWCLCFLDHRCNGAESLKSHYVVVLTAVLSLAFILLR